MQLKGEKVYFGLLLWRVLLGSAVWTCGGIIHLGENTQWKRPLPVTRTKKQWTGEIGGVKTHYPPQPNFLPQDSLRFQPPFNSATAGGQSEGMGLQETFPNQSKDCGLLWTSSHRSNRQLSDHHSYFQNAMDPSPWYLQELKETYMSGDQLLSVSRLLLMLLSCWPSVAEELFSVVSWVLCFRFQEVFLWHAQLTL